MTRANELIESVLAGNDPVRLVCLIEAPSDANELAEALDKVIRKHFPKSLVKVSFTTNLKPAVMGVFTVAASKDEVVSKILENDISITKFSVWGMDASGKFNTGKVEFNPFMGGSVHTSGDRIKVGLRKKSGTPEHIVKHVDAYFAKLKKTIDDNWDKIGDRYTSLLKSYKR